MKKSNRCYQFQHCRECSSTTPAVTGEEQLVRSAEDALVWAGGHWAFQLSVNSCAIHVFHLLLQKCASAEYQWLYCIYPLHGCLCKWTQVLAKAAFWEELTAHPLSALKLWGGEKQTIVEIWPLVIDFKFVCIKCCGLKNASLSIKSALLSFLGMAQIAQVLQRKQQWKQTHMPFFFFFLTDPFTSKEEGREMGICESSARYLILPFSRHLHLYLHFTAVF